MNGAFEFDEDNLILQLKNMPKPPISKEMAKEIGFDPKKYETVIDKLLVQISEVRKERLKENYIFEEKIKAMQNVDSYKQNKIRNNNGCVKNKPKNNSKNINKLLNLNRPKSNYKSVKSSGYGIAPKKINIFSTRERKKTKDNIKNNNNNKIPHQKILNKRNNNNNMPNFPNNKSNNSININNYNSHKINNNMNLSKKENIKNNINENIIKEDKNKINNIKNENINNPKLFYYDELRNEIEKIHKENQIIENRYQNLSDGVVDPLNIIMNNKMQNKNGNNNKLKNSKHIYYIQNYELIKQNIDLISKNIINDLLYELIFDLKDIEEQKSENKDNEVKKENKEQKQKGKNNINKKNFKFRAILNNKLIENCKKNKNIFKDYMKLKGSFFINNIFEVYDNFVEEMSNLLLDQGLNYCIKQMDDFIKKIENNK